MKVALISDIHGNLEALEASLAKIRSIGDIDKIVCLGDVVGYGADPEKCMDLIRANANVVIMGNHDAAMVGMTSTDNFNFAAKYAVTWTIEQLSEENLNYIKSLPYKVSSDNFLYLHASPSSENMWKYVTKFFDAYDEFDHFEENICFIGHSHKPGIYTKGGAISHTDGAVTYSGDVQYLVNIGSIGQPRDIDNRAAMCIVDNEKMELEIVRVEYDYKTAGKKIIEAGLAEFLASRLAIGK